MITDEPITPGRRGTGCGPWLIALAIAGVVLAGLLWGAQTLLGEAIRQQYDRMDAQNAVAYSAQYLAAEIEAGRPLPHSEIDFIDQLADFATENQVAWLLSHELGEGWVRYRPPPTGSPLQTDRCANDFLLWSDILDCEDLEWATEAFVEAIERRKAKRPA